MEIHGLANPALTIAIALAVGIVGQAVAVHARIPGIVVLLGLGVLLGPAVLGVLFPESLGEALNLLVGFAVAVILFEGGLNLNLSRLRRTQRPIRQLLTVGALVTALAATLCARLVMDWSWQVSALFGTLVIVTGPTVINPLLRRLRVERTVSTVLEAEGVLIDPIGAIIAVVALEAALGSAALGSVESLQESLGLLTGRLGFGLIAGLIGGYVLAWLLRRRNLVPEGMENVFTLSLVLALYQGSNALMAESGIAAVTIAGMVVGNKSSHVQEDLKEFKEQLTIMAIGMLFVILAADVRLESLQALGLRGVLLVVLLVVLVRPLNVLFGTWGTALTLRQRTFMAWMGPRGIVAAAIASLFAQKLRVMEIPGGDELRAMVFLVIAVTVTTAGLGGGILARLLGLQRPRNAGWVILGGNELAQELALLLRAGGRDVVLIDTNAHATMSAENRGLRVIFGNGLEERTLLRAEIDTRFGAIGLTGNEEVNLLFLQKARRLGGLRHTLCAISSAEGGVTPRMVRSEGGELLFGRTHDVSLWSERLRLKRARLGHFRLAREPGKQERETEVPDIVSNSQVLPLAISVGDVFNPVRRPLELHEGMELVLLIRKERDAEVVAELAEHGWQELQPDPKPETVNADADDSVNGAAAAQG